MLKRLLPISIWLVEGSRVGHTAVVLVQGFRNKVKVPFLVRLEPFENKLDLRGFGVLKVGHLDEVAESCLGGCRDQLGKFQGYIS